MKKVALAFAALALVGAGCGATKVGLEHGDNVPELVTLAEEALTCEFGEVHGFKGGYNGCAAYKKIKSTAKSHDAGFATVLNFLEDDMPAVRYAGAHAMAVGSFSKTNFQDQAAQSRVLAAVKAETINIAGVQMASPLSKFAEHGTDATSIVEWLKDYAGMGAAKQEFFRLAYSPHFKKAGIFEAAQHVAIDANEDENARKSAVRALGRATDPAQKEAAKKTLTDLLENNNTKVASEA